MPACQYFQSHAINKVNAQIAWIEKMKKALIAGLIALSVPGLVMADHDAELAFTAGAFEAFDSDFRATEIGVEYRFAPVASAFDLIPTLGVAINSDGGYWAYAGVRYDWDFSPKWTLTPSFAVAGYEDGAGRDLGYGMEFRTGLDLAYRLSDDSRLALGIYHMSNADIADDNPGSESVIVTYSFGF
jgi:hypothetical protein